MIPYASQTSGPNLRLIQAAGWRQMVSPDTARENGTNPPTMFALDNGAWPAFVHSRPWDEEAFMRCVDLMGARADFVVVPDVVANREATLAQADVWIAKLAGLPLYLALQDGMEWTDVDPFCSRLAGFFQGGSTDWKLRTMAEWGAYCGARGLRLHVGRVNTARRIRMCHDAGAHSFDGSSVSRFAKMNLRRLDNEVRQGWLF